MFASKITHVKNETVNRFLELDGVRGLAIFLVLIYHAFALGVPFAQNAVLIQLKRVSGIGWMGVDIFFVLSGFLITSILLETRDRSGYFKNFYARRILRIFPLYFLVFAVIFLFLPVLDPKAPLVERDSWPYFALYVQNWLYIPSFHLASFPQAIGPAWSLAIEEQFYLLWPALIFFLSRKKLVYLSITIFILTLVERFLFWEFGGSLFSSPQFLYFSSITRFDGFAVGALVSIAFQSARWKQTFSKLAWPVFLISLAVLFAIMFFTGTSEPGEGSKYWSIWGYSPIGLASGALIVILIFAPRQTIFSSFFRNRVLLFFGKYSYAIYLLHFPVMLVVLNKLTDAHIKGGKAWLIFVSLSFVLTILLSLLTWHLLEKQMLKLKKHFEN